MNFQFYKKIIWQRDKSNYSPDGHVESHTQKLAIKDTQINMSLDQGRRFSLRRLTKMIWDHQGDDKALCTLAVTLLKSVVVPEERHITLDSISDTM